MVYRTAAVLKKFFWQILRNFSKTNFCKKVLVLFYRSFEKHSGVLTAVLSFKSLRKAIISISTLKKKYWNGYTFFISKQVAKGLTLKMV